MLFFTPDLMAEDEWIWVHGKLKDTGLQKAYMKFTDRLVTYYTQSGLKITKISESQFSDHQTDKTVVFAGPIECFSNISFLDIPLKVIDKKKFKVSGIEISDPNTGVFIRNRSKNRIYYTGLSFKGFEDIFSVETRHHDCTITIDGAKYFEGDYSQDGLKLKPKSFLPNYPSNSEIADVNIPEGTFKASNISSDLNITLDSINSDFLQHIKEKTAGKKVFFFGECHWNENVNKLVEVLLMYLAKESNARALFQELNYSFSGYIDYYVKLVDDSKAKEFFNRRLHYMVNTDVGLDLLKKIRSWNIKNPDKIISLGCLDMEWGIYTVIDHIVIPYFKKLDPSFKITDDDFADDDAYVKLHKRMKILLQKASTNNVIGEYPFITSDYIGNVLENLKDTVLLKDMNGDRQRAVIRNITEYNKHLFKDGMVMFHGGGWHAVKEPEPSNFFRDAEYLFKKFPPTKGSVYTLMCEGLGYGFKNIASNLQDEHMSSATYYNKIVRNFQKSFKLNCVSIDDYFMLNETDDYIKLLARYGSLNNCNIFSLDEVDWERLSSEFDDSVMAGKNAQKNYDDVLYVLKSQIVGTRKLKLTESIKLDYKLKSSFKKRFLKPDTGKESIYK